MPLIFLCFPYCPGVNFITDRPTFLYFLYVDDAILNRLQDKIDAYEVFLLQ